jgi:hypothetical protein
LKPKSLNSSHHTCTTAWYMHNHTQYIYWKPAKIPPRHILPPS